MVKLAIISLGGKSSQALAVACRKYFEVVDELSLKDIEVCVSDLGVVVRHLKKNLERYDCVYVRGSYKYALLQRSITRALQGEAYMPLKSKAFSLGHDKYLTLLELQKNGVAIPKTHYAANKRLALKLLEEEISYPVIIKAQEGTHGNGVMIADNFKHAREVVELLSEFNRPYVIQEFVSTDGTSDLRVIVGGGRVLGAYKRIASEGEFRSNIHAGGRREAHVLTEGQAELAIKSSEAIGANLCGVDILNNGHPSVIEINLSPALTGMEGVVGVDLLDEVSRMLFVRTKKFLKKRKEKAKKKMKKKAVKTY